MGVDFVTGYEDVRLSPQEMWFLPMESAEHPHELGLKIYISDYDISKKDTFLQASFQVIDAIFGEKSAALDIRHVEIDRLPENPEKQGLIEFRELPEYIAWRKKQL